MVRIRMRTSGKRGLILLVTAMPSRSGMLRSSKSTSGRVFSTQSMASYPPLASATSSSEASVLSSVRSPVRTMAWSSVMSTLGMAGDLDVDRRALAGRALDGELAAQHLHPLAHPEQAQMVLEHGGGGEGPDDVILDGGDHLAVALAAQHIHAAGLGVQDDVGQRLLDDPEQRRLHLDRQSFRLHAHRFELDLHGVLPAELADILLEGGDEAEMV